MLQAGCSRHRSLRCIAGFCWVALGIGSGSRLTRPRSSTWAPSVCTCSLRQGAADKPSNALNSQCHGHRWQGVQWSLASTHRYFRCAIHHWLKA
jgi:hypothetical protein